MRLRLRWILSASLMAALACGGKLLPLPGGRDAGEDQDAGAVDGGADGADGSEDGTSPDGRAPPPLPECVGATAECVPPDAGIVWHGAAVIKCKPEMYVGPWTLLLERKAGTNFSVIQTQVVQEPGFGATFNDEDAPPSEVSYRVCTVELDGTTACGASFLTQPAPNCGCEPTSCALNSACDTPLDDWCGQTLQCGACPNGAACNADKNCCPAGLMPDGWGGCVCAPTTACPRGYFWNTVTCSCQSSQAPIRTKSGPRK